MRLFLFAPLGPFSVADPCLLSPDLHPGYGRAPLLSKQHEGSTSSSQTTVDKETEQKLEEINKAFETNRDQVISKLLDRVVDVKTELHRNLQLQQQQKA